MKRYILLSFGMVLLNVGCNLSSLPPRPGIPVTGPTSAGVPSPGPRGSALFFDGHDDYVMVPDDLSLDLGGSFTITAWIYLEEYTEWASLATKGDKPNLNNYAIHQSGPFDPIYKTEFGHLRFSGCVGLAAPLPESETVIPLESWQFVAVTFDGLRIQFYWNGMPDGGADLPGPLCANDSPLYIGVDFPLTTEYWHGAIDELGIWNSTLSETQLRDIMNGGQVLMDSSLVGYWTFDEAAGDIAHDLSVHANHGTLIGDPVWIRP